MDAARGTTATLRATVRKVRNRNLTFVAGSLAYNAFVSLVPLLVLLLLAAGTVGDERLMARISALAQSVLTPEAQNLVADALTNTRGQTGVSVAGVLVMLWGALKLFRGLDTAFAEVYGTTDGGSLLGQLRDGLVALVVVTVSLLTVGLAAGAFAYFNLPYLHLLNPILLLVGLSLAFFPMYYVFPHVDLTAGEALPGAVVAAGGWAVLEVGFQIYAANAGRYEAYGVIGGVLLVITWLYFSGLVLLVGAAVNAVIWERNRSAAVDAVTAREAPTEPADGEDPTTGTRSGSAARDETPPGADGVGRASTATAPDGSADAETTGDDAADEVETVDATPLDSDDPPLRARRTPTLPRRTAPRARRAASQSFLFGVAVGAFGCVALLATTVWRWLD